MMELIFEKSYKLLLGTKDPCTGEIKLFFPGEEKNINKMLLYAESSKYEIGEYSSLHALSGTYHSEYERRYIKQTFEAKDWDSLEKDMMQFIEESLETFKEIMKENKKLIEDKPKTQIIKRKLN